MSFPAIAKKLARVTPIYKSGPKTYLNNYWPISVISVFSTMLERLALDQLYEFFKQNACNQVVFRKLYSTVAPFTSSTDFWYTNIDHSMANLTIFLDIKEAFHTVDYVNLLKNLYVNGIRGKGVHWFDSYLNNRRQFCSLNGQHSKARKVTCGIPQGSCLGPLPFIICLNDLEKCLKFSRASIHADDTRLHSETS